METIKKTPTGSHQENSYDADAEGGHDDSNARRRLPFTGDGRDNNGNNGDRLDSKGWKPSKGSTKIHRMGNNAASGSKNGSKSGTVVNNTGRKNLDEADARAIDVQRYISSGDEGLSTDNELMDSRPVNNTAHDRQIAASMNASMHASMHASANLSTLLAHKSPDPKDFDPKLSKSGSKKTSKRSRSGSKQSLGSGSKKQSKHSAAGHHGGSGAHSTAPLDSGNVNIMPPTTAGLAFGEPPDQKKAGKKTSYYEKFIGTVKGTNSREPTKDPVQKLDAAAQNNGKRRGLDSSDTDGNNWSTDEDENNGGNNRRGKNRNSTLNFKMSDAIQNSKYTSKAVYYYIDM
jgi:hypothetical protein